ncbi:hypothetical protein [Planomonospora parontospora]|uniref:hypothetical protein n=1 Tax=Planomonospora parontospora TaxID=58119 RepID=UPI001783C2B3|nr:hypothetical protein [Planomonospora parontospora]
MIVVLAALSVSSFAGGSGSGLEFMLIAPATYPLGTATLDLCQSSGLCYAEVGPPLLQNLLPLIMTTVGGLMQAGLLWLALRVGSSIKDRRQIR